MNSNPPSCLYCNSPNVILMQPSKISYSLRTFLRQIISKGTAIQYKVLNGPLKVRCPFCGREYLIIAMPEENEEFITNLLEKLEFEDEYMIAQELKRYGIDPADIFYNVRGIVIPEGFVNEAKKWASTKVKKVAYELHIIFSSRGQNFYLSVYRNNQTGMIMGKHIERAF